MLIEYGIYLCLSLFKLFLFSVYTGTDFSFGFLFINIASVLVLSSWTLLLKKRKQRIIWLLLLFLHSTLLVSDVWYYRYFGDLLSVSLIADVPQMTSVGGGFLTLVRPYDFLFFTDLLLFGAALVFLKFRPAEPARRTKRLAAGTIGFAGIALFTVPLTWSYVQQEEWLVGDTISNMQEYYQLGFWGYHGVDIIEHTGKLIGSGSELTNEQQTLLEEVLPGRASAEESDSADAPNVIVVQLESFQSHVIGHEVNGRELTPNLNRLQEEMLYFPNFYHQTHEGRTSDAEFTVLTSLYPIKSGSVYTRYGDNEFNSLPEQLKQMGYETAAMHAYDKTFWNRDGFYANIGIDQFFSEEDFPNGEIIGMALNDKDFLQSSADFMQTLPEPYFAFMVALTSHTPYEFPEDKQKLDLGGFDDPLVKGYYETVHYVDEAVADMVERLKQDGLWDSSLVVFYGDHDSGLVYAGSEMADEMDAKSPVSLFELDKGVPLWIKPPELETGSVIENVGGQIDIAPTILDILGVEPPFMLGHSLMDDKPNLTVFRNGSFRYEDLYFKPDLTTAFGAGTCYSVSTEREIPLSSCEPHIVNAAAQLRVSDLVIEENALEQLGGE